MKRLSLQNDNKIKKRNTFFDVDESEEEPDIETENRIKESETKKESKSERKFKGLAAVFVCIVCIVLVTSIVLLCVDLSDGKLDGVFVKKEPTVTYYNIIDEPDWTTDIYTVEEYVSKNPDFIKYSPDGRVTVGYTREDISPSLNPSLYFIQAYIDAIKLGDHEKLNSLLSNAYKSKNGEFEDFPMQKLYNIEVKKLPNPQPDVNEGKYYKHEYYSISYNIYKNDGYYCKTADESRAMVEGIMLVYDSQGNIKIEIRYDSIAKE